MIKAALEYVVGLKKPETVRHGGGVYADKPLYQMKKADFPTLKLNTLESIVRYVQKIGDERQSEDYEAVEPIIIHIESATCVALKDIANVGDGKRDCMVLATADVPFLRQTVAHGSWRRRRTSTTIWRSSWKKILTAAKWFCLFEKRRSWKNEQSDFNGAADKRP